MAVLYTITAYPPSIGGAQLHLHEFACRIQSHYQTGVLYQWDMHRTDFLMGTTLKAPPPHRPEPRDGVPAYRISLDKQQRRWLTPWVWAYPFLQSPSIHYISEALLKNLRAAAYDVLGQAPTVIHNSRVGREGITMASFKLARQLDVPFLLTPNHHHHWKGWFYRDYNRIYRSADAVIVQTNYEKQELIALGVQAERIHILGIGPILADQPDNQRFRQQHGIPLDVPLILFLGQKYKYKRFETLLDAIPLIRERYPETYFAFVGPRTDYSNEVFARVEDAQMVELDTVDLQTKTDALAACDILCVPSAKESFGGVYLEAWMMGKPVIAGDAPASSEVVEHAGGGFMVSEDHEQTAMYILRLLDDSALCADLGDKGREFAMRYTWDKLTSKLVGVYETLLYGSPRSVTGVSQGATSSLSQDATGD